MQKFHRYTDGNILTNIVKTQIGIVNKYREWQNKSEEVIEKSFSEKYYKKTNPTIINKLMACKRKAKKYLNGIKKFEDRELIKFQIQLINKYILNEQEKIKAKKIENEIQKLRRGGGINSSSFWEFKKTWIEIRKRNT